MSAIILDGELKSALACVRSLGKKGISLSVGAPRSTAMSIHSKYTTVSFLYPSPYVDQKGFVAAVKEEAMRLGDKPVIFALSDSTYLSLYAFREELSIHAALVFPTDDSVEIAFDKASTNSLAQVSGIPTISTHTPLRREEVIEVGERLHYPAVLKPRRSVSWREGKGVFGSVSFIQSKEELIQKFFLLRDMSGEAPLIQDLMLGEEYGVEMLVREGVPYALVSHQRLRSLSPTGGASVLKKTLGAGTLKEILEAQAVLLASKLSWSGPLMVEFKVDHDSQKPYLMEINGRFWGSLPLSIASGVDMPSLYYDAVTQNIVPREIVRGRGEMITSHFLGEVLHLARVLFARDPMRALLYPSRFQAIENFLFLPPGTKDDVWSLRDLKPGIMEIVDSIKKRIWK